MNSSSVIRITWMFTFHSIHNRLSYFLSPRCF
nr:MAG TPA: hypothetical protein [Crassvirales sp.]